MIRWKLWISLLAFLAGALSSNPSGQSLHFSAALTQGYIWWSLFWGVPAVWSWWLSSGRFLFSSLQGSCIASLLRFVLSSLLLIFSACFFSVFGGGIYQCLKYLWQTRTYA